MSNSFQQPLTFLNLQRQDSISVFGDLERIIDEGLELKEEVDPIYTLDIDQELRDIVCEINKKNLGEPVQFPHTFVSDIDLKMADFMNRYSKRKVIP